jgi:hypothetical protein
LEEQIRTKIEQKFEKKFEQNSNKNRTKFSLHPKDQENGEEIAAKENALFPRTDKS